jgi:phage tail sheath protein FI
VPVKPTYPGVYIEEVPSGVRTITGVATSITAFVGYTPKGTVNKAVRIHNWGDYERQFGGLDRNSLVSYAVQQFFLNGGSDAYVVRVASGAHKAGVVLKDGGTPVKDVLDVTALSEGEWGNLVELDVDHDATNEDGQFNLTATKFEVRGTNRVAVDVEKHRNLNMNSHSPGYAPSVVNSASRLVRIARKSALTYAKGYALSKPIVFPQVSSASNTIAGILDDGKSFMLLLGDTPVTNMAGLLAAVTTAITKSGLPAGAMKAVQAGLDGQVSTTGDRLRLESKTEDDYSSVVIVKAPAKDLAAQIGLGIINGGGEVDGAVAHRPAEAQAIPLSGGADGSRPDATDLIGSYGDKTGIYSLRDVDLFNLLVIPETTFLVGAGDTDVISAANSFCEEERAFYLLDPDPTKDGSTIPGWVSNVGTSKNAAVFFPQVSVADPLDEYRLAAKPPSGTIAGLMARTDAERGIWKAPAGTDAALRGVQGLTTVLTDPESGDLNQLGINCLRNFPVYGNICWGARTLFGSDQMASEWKYIPVRRTALFIEETLYRGTQWVVFEPNAEPLWAQIRMNIGSFMHGLFRQGAFQGTTPKEAYFVKCDRETTTQDDINQGIVNILVGFAPLKPAEFVMIKLQQMAGQIQV